MYIPIFIAILMGLLSPINQSNHKLKGKVYVKMDGMAPQPTTYSTDSIPPGDGEPGIGGDTGGETGNNPPRP